MAAKDEAGARSVGRSVKGEKSCASEYGDDDDASRSPDDREVILGVVELRCSSIGWYLLRHYFASHQFIINPFCCSSANEYGNPMVL
jgi:hypothetical protein